MIKPSVVDSLPFRSGDEDQTARLLRQVADDRRKPELLEGEDLERNGAERRPHRAALHEDIGAETGESLHAEGEVELVLLLELVLLRVRQDGIAELLRLHRRERRRLERHQPPVDAQLRGEPVVMWRSEAPFSTIALRSWCRFGTWCPLPGRVGGGVAHDLLDRGPACLELRDAC